MVGIIVTGHGNFGSGLTSSIDLIAGPQKNFKSIDFEGDSTEKLEKNLEEALTELSNSCEGIIIFCDLPGGSPFKTAVIKSQVLDNVEIIAGTNLPMLAEITMARSMIEDVAVLANTAVDTGKDQIIRFDSSNLTNSTNNEPADGIGI